MRVPRLHFWGGVALSLNIQWKLLKLVGFKTWYQRLFGTYKLFLYIGEHGRNGCLHIFTRFVFTCLPAVRQFRCGLLSHFAQYLESFLVDDLANKFFIFHHLYQWLLALFPYCIKNYKILRTLYFIILSENVETQVKPTIEFFYAPDLHLCGRIRYPHSFSSAFGLKSD